VSTTLHSYAEFQAYIDAILDANGQLPVGGPHRRFWGTMTYDEFVSGDVPHVSDPATGGPMKILTVGDSKSSIFVQALAGTPGTPFDPETGDFGQMPANGPPYFTDEQIAPIAAWIDAGCPR
jgi:hypothetical protein